MIAKLLPRTISSYTTSLARVLGAVTLSLLSVASFATSAHAQTSAQAGAQTGAPPGAQGAEPAPSPRPAPSPHPTDDTPIAGSAQGGASTRTPVPAAVLDAPPPPPAEAETGRSLSIGGYVGIRTDMAQLGQTIAKDGTTEISQNSILRAFGATKNLVMSDKDDEALLRASQGTNSAYQFLREHKSGGPLIGATIGFEVKWDFNERAHLPLFAKIGVDYTFRITGGKQERVLGPAIDTATPFGAAVREVTGGTDGGRLRTTFNADWLEVPLTVGFAMPIPGGHRVYAGFGLSYFNGGFSTGFDVDDKYARAATTFTDGTTLYGPLEQNGINREIQFRYSGMGPNFVFGAETKVGRGALFLEFYGAGAADTVYSNDFSADGQRLFTAISSNVAGGVVTPYASDPTLFKRIAYPVVLGGTYFRLGYRFYLL